MTISEIMAQVRHEHLIKQILKRRPQLWRWVR